MKRRYVLLLLVSLVLLAGGIAYTQLTAPPPVVEDTSSPPPPTIAGKVETEEDKTRRLLLGVWQDDYEGKRTMTLNADGTGTMLVELSGIKAMLSAPKLRFDMKWSLDGKMLKKTTVSGEPAKQVNAILNLMGNTAVEPILELTDERLLLQDKDGKTKYDWRRPKNDKPKKE